MMIMMMIMMMTIVTLLVNNSAPIIPNIIATTIGIFDVITVISIMTR